MTDAAGVALYDVFMMCLRAGRCDLCGRGLVEEAVAHAETVWCVPCAAVHGAGRRMIHAVWQPGLHLADAGAGDRWP